MKGTKLWQEPRSPLISGRSRRDRPFSRDLLLGTVLGVLVAAGTRMALTGGQGFETLIASLRLAAIGSAAAAVGCAILVMVARRFGWRPFWIAGTVGGTLSALAAAGVYAAVVAR